MSPSFSVLLRFPPRKGFTLIELLVVVSITALLISILVPSLRGAREQARVVACTANLKGIATASLTYASSDRRGQMVPVHGLVGVVAGDVGAYDWGGKAGRGEPTAGNDATSSIWGTSEGRGPATRPLNDVLFKRRLNDYTNDPGPNQGNWIGDYELDLAQFRCPSDRGYTGVHYGAWENSGLSSFDHYGTSYAASLQWNEDHLPSYPAEPCHTESFSVYGRMSARVPNPANTVYYFENCGRFAWLVNYGADIAADPLGSSCSEAHGVPTRGEVGARLTVAGWHRRSFQFTTSFADGHAGVVQMRGHQRPTPHLSSYPGYIKGLPEGAAGTYFTYRCVIIRGAGWQIDTLPAPPAVTPVQCGQISTVPWRGG